MKVKFWIFILINHCTFSSILFGQVRVLDFDKATYKNGIVYDKLANWKTVYSSLSPNEIDGTPALVLDYRPTRPYGSAESGFIAGGCKCLSFDFKRLGVSNCDVAVWVNNKLVTTIDQTN
jgi:hypothetical protein